MRTTRPIVLALLLAANTSGCDRTNCERPLHPVAAVVAKSDLRAGLPLLESDYESTTICTHNPVEWPYSRQAIRMMHGVKLAKSVPKGTALIPSHFGPAAAGEPVTF